MEAESKKISEQSLKTVCKKETGDVNGTMNLGNICVLPSSLSFTKIEVLKEPSTSATLAIMTTKMLTTTNNVYLHKTRISTTNHVSATKPTPSTKNYHQHLYHQQNLN